MRKNFGSKPYVFPQPVFMIGSYDEEGIADVMNAAWGSIADYKQIALYLGANHKTMENILKRKAFTVSMADEKHVIEADYFGMVSAHNEPNKVSKVGFHVSKSEFVDAPIIDEFLLTLECKMIRYDQDSELLLGEIINVSVDESILDDEGRMDVAKLKPISFNASTNTYHKVGGVVGNAFHDGNTLKK